MSKRNKNDTINISEDLLEVKGQSLLVGTAVVILLAFVLTFLFTEQKQYLDTRKALSAQPTTSPVPTQGFVAPQQSAEASTLYEVRNGDSLAKIGNRLCNSKSAWKHLASDNGIFAPYTLKRGQIIHINCR